MTQAELEFFHLMNADIKTLVTDVADLKAAVLHPDPKHCIQAGRICQLEEEIVVLTRQKDQATGVAIEKEHTRRMLERWISTLLSALGILAGVKNWQGISDFFHKIITRFAK